MSKQAKITASQFQKEWVNPKTNQTIYYHSIELDNGDKGQIGSNKQSPDFLSVGSTLEYDIDGDKIKRVQPAKSFGGGGYKPDTVGITVGACLNLAVSMYNAGKFDDIKKVESTADWLVEMSFRLKSKHADKA